MSVLEEIGLFEPSFFAHMEEIDFCWRAQNFGYKVMVEPASLVYHVGGGTLPQGNPRKTFFNARNGLGLLYKNLPKGKVFPTIFIRLILDGVWGAKSLLSLDWKTPLAIIKAHFAFYGDLGTWRKQRREYYGSDGPPKAKVGWYERSVVWQHFARGKKRFDPSCRTEMYGSRPGIAKRFPLTDKLRILRKGLKKGSFPHNNLLPLSKHTILRKIKLVAFAQLEEKTPTHQQVNGLDLVLIRYGENVSVLYGRCLHRGALMADGHIEGDNLICGLHGWDYRYDTGVSEYNNKEVLHKFFSEVTDGCVWVDKDEINDFLKENPQPFNRDQYLGQYADTHPESTEPFTGYIKELAQNRLKNYGHHGPSAAMGVDRNTLPKWEDIQFLPAQLASRPLLDEEAVSTKVVIIGPRAKQAAQARDSSVRIRHELWSTFARGQGCALQRSGAGRHRHLLRRRRHAPRRAGKQQPLFL
jgi:nitrite reductase/ring-hydroxylating ferredoxin subunit